MKSFRFLKYYSYTDILSLLLFKVELKPGFEIDSKIANLMIINICELQNKINAFATSCYRVMLNIKRIDHVLNTTVYSMTNTVPLIHLVRHRQLKFLGHILRMSKEEPARRYALYIPTIGKRRPGRPRTSYLNYVQRLLGDNEGAMQEQQIAAFADDRRAWRNLVVACSAADG